MRRTLELVEQIAFPRWVGLVQSIEDQGRTKRLRKGELFPVRWGSLLRAAPLSSAPGKHRSSPAPEASDTVCRRDWRLLCSDCNCSDFPLPGVATISSSAPAPPLWESSHRGNAAPRCGGKWQKEETLV